MTPRRRAAHTVSVAGSDGDVIRRRVCRACRSADDAVTAGGPGALTVEWRQWWPTWNTRARGEPGPNHGGRSRRRAGVAGTAPVSPGWRCYRHAPPSSCRSRPPASGASRSSSPEWPARCGPGRRVVVPHAPRRRPLAGGRARHRRTPLTVGALFARADLLWVSRAVRRPCLGSPGGRARCNRARPTRRTGGVREPARPRHAVLILNPALRRWKVGRFDLVRRAEALGVQAILLDGPGVVDVAALARRAVAEGRGPSGRGRRGRDAGARRGGRRGQRRAVPRRPRGNTQPLRQDLGLRTGTTRSRAWTPSPTASSCVSTWGGSPTAPS